MCILRLKQKWNLFPTEEMFGNMDAKYSVTSTNTLTRVVALENIA